MRKLLGNLPLIAGLAIVVVFSTDLRVASPWKTEGTFGLWLVILLPAAILLLVVQCALWVAVLWWRPWKRAS